MTDAVDVFHVKGADGVIRSLDEHYDCQKDVEKDPHGAWLAIQNQADRIKELEAENARRQRALERLEVTEFCAAPASEDAIKMRALARAALQDNGEE